MNEIVGKFSPLADDETLLAAGDLVKIQLGVHIDGHVVMAAQSIFVGVAPALPVVGRAADVVCAATMAAEVVLRLLRPGTKVRLLLSWRCSFALRPPITERLPCRAG